MSDLHREIVEIGALLSRAEQDLGLIRWDAHHPDYPDSLIELMRGIARSGWMTGDYRKYPLADVLVHVDTAGLDEIRCAMTRLNRSEKWCTGSWIQVMEDGSLGPLVKRGQELTAPQPGARDSDH